MKTNINTKISTGLLAAIITLGASLSERSVHADEVKARHTAVQAKAPESPTRHTAVQTPAPETPTRYTLLRAKAPESPTRHTAVQAPAPETPTRYTLLQAKAPENPNRHTAVQAPAPETPTRCDHTAALHEIDLKVALKQYEKVAQQVEDTKLQTALGPEEKGLSDQQIMQWKDTQNRKQALFEVTAKQLRDKIEQLMAEANREAEANARRAAGQSSRSSPPSMGSNPAAPLKTPAVK